MANNLKTDERKWVLKEYWKSQNAEIVRTNWHPHTLKGFCIIVHNKILLSINTCVSKYNCLYM